MPEALSAPNDSPAASPPRKRDLLRVMGGALERPQLASKRTMEHALSHGVRATRPDAALALGAQLSRDARARLFAAAAVVVVHSAYPPGHPVLMALSPAGQRAHSLILGLVVSFPVNTFILLSFLNLAPRLRAGVPASKLLRAAAHRLVPPHLFWATVYLGTKALLKHQIPSPRAIVEGFVLGTAAGHLYFTPVLLALTATAPLLWRVARAPRLALVSGLALALPAVALRAMLGGGDPWSHAIAGFAGFLPFALAGLALARSWGGLAPALDRSPRVLSVAGPLTAVSAVVLAHAALDARPGVALTATGWLGGNAYALGVPLLLLALPGAPSSRLVRLAQYTLGVYLIHPLFIQALRAVEGRVSALSGFEATLIAPNAIAAGALSIIAVAALARTPLRRLVM